MADKVHVFHQGPRFDHQAQKWVLYVTVCNQLSRWLRVRVAENPVLDNGKKRYRGRNAAERAKRNGKTLHLRPRSQSRACRTARFEFTRKPVSSYTDVYEIENWGQPDETVGDRPLEGGAAIKILTPIKARKTRQDPRFYTAVDIPIPYPMSAETQWSGEISVVIDKVVGLPREVQLVASFPKVRQPLKLDFGDRTSTATLILRERMTLRRGQRYTVAIHQKIVKPKKLAKWTPRVVTFDLVGTRRAVTGADKKKTAARKTKRK